ncbi:kinase-like domain-containing protein [Sporodiniella umbellata]|nr:kinase-like domain-containing protein [Sporodiniella umbellata]
MFFTEEGECSVHYFTACHLETFIRAVHAVSLQSSDYVMKSHRAIVLASPTPKFNYQCLWITSRTLPSNTLHTFLLHKKPSEKQKARWIWCFLKAVQSVHQHGLVHLSIDTHSFYQTASGDWILGNFVTVQKQGSLLSCNYSSGFMPPEYLKEGPHLATAEADLWSLGGVIYTLVTQDLVTLADEMVLDNVKDPYSRTLLDDILQVSPNCRKSIQSALDSWNSIYHFEST